MSSFNRLSSPVGALLVAVLVVFGAAVKSTIASSELLAWDGCDFPVGYPDGVGWNNGSNCIEPNCSSGNCQDGSGFLEPSNQGLGCHFHPGEDWNLNTGGDTECDGPLSTHEDVHAIANGTVIALPENCPWGVLVIRHDNVPGYGTLWSCYGHMDSSAVPLGPVARGQVIGKVSHKGTTSTCHLHFEIRKVYNGDPCDYPNPSQGEGTVAWVTARYLSPSEFINANRPSSVTSFGGTVTYSSTSIPAPFATVTWGPYSTVANWQGAYSFQSVRCGTQPLQACSVFGACSTPFAYTPPCSSQGATQSVTCPGGGCVGNSFFGDEPLFSPGDTVQVVGTGTLGLRAWLAECSGGYVVKPNGSLGTIVSGPVLCDGYLRWKIQWQSDGAIRWSAQGDCNTGDIWLQAVVGNQPPEITTSNPLPTGTVGVNYSKTLVAQGGTSPNAWTIVSGGLPPGLSMAASSGHISGTPTTAGTNYHARVRVTDAAGLWDEKNFDLDVNPAAGTLQIVPASDVSIAGPVGGPFLPTSFTYQLHNTGSTTLHWSWDHFVPWLTPSSGNGGIGAGVTTDSTWTVGPSALLLPAGTYHATLHITDTDHDVAYTRSISLVVGSPASQCTAGSKLIPLAPTPSAGTRFGYSVAVSGDYAAVGRGGSSVGGQRAAHVFQRQGTAWTQVAALSSPSPVVFGERVALTSNADGDWVAVSDEGAGAVPFAGVVRLYKRSGSSWIADAVLSAPDGALGDQFGKDVALDGALCIVGAFEDDDPSGNPGFPDAGSAYVFRWNGSTWAQEAKLFASSPVANSRFGGSVAVLGTANVELAAVTAAGASSAYIYRKTAAGWVEEQVITPPAPTTFDYAGRSIALAADQSGQILAILGDGLHDCDDRSGAHECGIAYIYQRVGTSWQLESTLSPPVLQASCHFGRAVGLATHAGKWTAVVGADGDDSHGPDSGSAFVFERAASGWRMVSSILATDPAPGDGFGSSVALDARTGTFRLMVGAEYSDDNGGLSGSSYAFDLSESPLAITLNPVGQDLAAGTALVLTAQAIGNHPMSYRWYRDGEALVDGGSTQGATSNTLTINPVGLSHAGLYEIEVANVCGSLLGQPAVVTVYEPCSGDLNSNGLVDGADLGILLGFWGATTTFPAADINHDGVVNGADLGMLLGNWGPCLN